MYLLDGSKPIFNSLIEYLHPNCRKTLKVLNLGCTYVDRNITSSLSKFINIEFLNLDYTQIDSDSFLKITENMQNLKNLSIENMNGEKVK